MAARWSETRPERREDAGPGAAAGCALLVFAFVYFGLHAVLWSAQAVIA